MDTKSMFIVFVKWSKLQWVFPMEWQCGTKMGLFYFALQTSEVEGGKREEKWSGGRGGRVL